MLGIPFYIFIWSTKGSIQVSLFNAPQFHVHFSFNCSFVSRVTIRDQYNRCLTMPNSANGAIITVSDCNGAPGQQFLPTPTSLGSNYTQKFTIKTYYSSCVDIKDGATANGTPIQQWMCYSGVSTQMLAFVPDQFNIQTFASCLDDSGSNYNGVQLKQVFCGEGGGGGGGACRIATLHLLPTT